MPSAISNPAERGADQRRELQFAVGGLWPAGKPEDAAIRTEFKVPPDKPLEG